MTTDLEKRIEDIRSFNRMYVQRIGVLTERVFDSPYSLTELKIIYELSVKKSTTATHIRKSMSLDGGYLSRILNKFEKEGMIKKERSKNDARQHKISFTKKGEKTWEAISAEARNNVLKMLEPLSVEQQVRMTAAMNTIASILMSVD